jgi:hypothetical protein
MASNQKILEVEAEAELTLPTIGAKSAQTRTLGLGLAERGAKASGNAQGSDPYNNSGSFDRKKNWTRVGKR